MLVKSIDSEIRSSFLSDKGIETPITSYQALNELAVNKSIIGFGEATHGSLELRAAFCDLAKELISNKKVNVVAFAERDFCESTSLWKFITRSQQDIDGQILLPYSTKMERDLVLWIQRYNANKAFNDKVWILGLDIFNTKAAAHQVITWIEDLNIDLPDKHKDILHDISSLPFYYNIYTEKYSIDQIARLMGFLEGEAAKADISETIKQIFFQVVKNFRHSVEFSYSGNQQIRDQAMFDNLAWIRQQRPSQVLIFAHNSHLEKETGNTLSSGIKRLGHLIGENYPQEYLCIGSDIAKGTYRAGPNNRIYEIPTSFNKIGNIIGKSVQDSSGYLLWKKSDALQTFFNKDRFITYGVLDTDRPTYPIHKNSVGAFDALYWIRTSSPMEVSAKNDFTLLLPMNKTFHSNVLSRDSLHLSFNSSFAPINEAINNSSLSFGVTLFSNNKNIGFTRIILEDIDKNEEIKMKIPDNCDSLNLFIYGETVQYVQLRDVIINDSTLNFKNFLYNGENYTREILDSSAIALTLKY